MHLFRLQANSKSLLMQNSQYKGDRNDVSEVEKHSITATADTNTAQKELRGLPGCFPKLVPDQHASWILSRKTSKLWFGTTVNHDQHDLLKNLGEKKIGQPTKNHGKPRKSGKEVTDSSFIVRWGFSWFSVVFRLILWLFVILLLKIIAIIIPVKYFALRAQQIMNSRSCGAENNKCSVCLGLPVVFIDSRARELR